MTEEQKKAVVKWLGECWHECNIKTKMYAGYVMVCRCGRFAKNATNRTFKDEKDFFACFDKLVEKGEIRRFAMRGQINNSPEAWFVDVSRTESGEYRLCQLVAEWLRKEAQDE